MVIDINALKSLEYFNNLSLDELEEIKPLFYQETLETGTRFVREGEQINRLFFIVSGQVKCYRTTNDGKEWTVHIGRPGESLTDVPVFDEGESVIFWWFVGVVDEVFTVHYDGCWFFMVGGEVVFEWFVDGDDMVDVFDEFFF